MSFAPGQDSGTFYVLDQGVRLLFADDDPILREFATVHLGTADGGVVTAEDGEAAWDVLQAQRFDLLLIDLEMPRLDGFGLVRRLRQEERFRSLPVIVVTGREDVNAIDRAFEAGATSFVVKPINWRLLTYQVRFVLRAQRAEAKLHAARHGGADASAAVRRLMSESAELLELARSGEPRLREAAERYAHVLTRMAGGAARDTAA